ncbi:MAG: hypothetical protein HUJ26_23000 [Planctomycetaceae bacterium]|nr:hypothetical protein [Planctomycetaceae bacterium]
MMGRWFGGLVCASAMLGCYQEANVRSTSISSAQEELRAIRRTLSRQLNRPTTEFRNDVPTNEWEPPLNAYQFVDLVTAIEQKYDITLPREKLLDSEKTNPQQRLLERNTLNRLAIITFEERHPDE